MSQAPPLQDGRPTMTVSQRRQFLEEVRFLEVRHLAYLHYMKPGTSEPIMKYEDTLDDRAKVRQNVLNYEIAAGWLIPDGTEGQVQAAPNPQPQTQPEVQQGAPQMNPPPPFAQVPNGAPQMQAPQMVPQPPPMFATPPGMPQPQQIPQMAPPPPPQYQQPVPQPMMAPPQQQMQPAPQMAPPVASPQQAAAMGVPQQQEAPAAAPTGRRRKGQGAGVAPPPAAPPPAPQGAQAYAQPQQQQMQYAAAAPQQMAPPMAAPAPFGAPPAQFAPQAPVQSGFQPQQQAPQAMQGQGGSAPGVDLSQTNGRIDALTKIVGEQSTQIKSLSGNLELALGMLHHLYLCTPGLAAQAGQPPLPNTLPEFKKYFGKFIGNPS